MGIKIRVVDATHVSEPGSKGSNYRVHYAFDPPQMQCAEVKVTDYKRGETFKNFTIEVLELYRGRWQIELVFKRIKSILETGHVPNKNPIAAQAWIQGKVFCSLLIQKGIDAAKRFSPLYRSQLQQAA